MAAAKDRHRAVPATLMQDFARVHPAGDRRARDARRHGLHRAGRVAPLFNVVISNVPGPQFPLYSAGALMLGNYPLSAITDGLGLNITVMSYNGRLDFGLLACREMVPDIWQLLEYHEESLEELKTLAGVGVAKSNGKPKEKPAKPRKKGKPAPSTT